jgi:hypothetical protein
LQDEVDAVLFGLAECISAMIRREKETLRRGELVREMTEGRAYFSDHDLRARGLDVHVVVGVAIVAIESHGQRT